MKTGYIVAGIIAILFMFSFATFNVCVSHTDKLVDSLSNRLSTLESLCGQISEENRVYRSFIEQELNRSHYDTLVLKIMPQRLNLNVNTK